MAQPLRGLAENSTPNKAEGKNDLAQRTKAFALAVIRTTDDLQRTTSSIVLGKQVLHSATSIGANYREASRGHSRPEFIAKIGDCLRETKETAYWLELFGGFPRLVTKSFGASTR